MSLPTSRPGRAVAGAAALATAAASLAVAGAVAAPPASATDTYSTLYTYDGSSHTFTVPDGVTSLTVTALGASGYTSGSSGGRGASVSATLPVGPNESIHTGDVLVVRVGGDGDRNAGGFNGGGDGGKVGGGGGGASDVRLPSDTLAARILVAAGGGGQGYDDVDSDTSGLGGDAGQPGADAPDDGFDDNGKGGQAGPSDPNATNGGAGGAGGNAAQPGSDGAPGVGGTGGAPARSMLGSGGGGGGGYLGGGGGGAGGPCGGCGGGGGGGGSSYVEASATDVVTGPATDSARVWISYTMPSAQAITFTSTPPTDAHAGDSYTVSATGGQGSGQPVTFSLDPTTTGFGTSAVACRLAGSTVSLLRPGTCRVDADQAGNTEYAPAPQAHQDVVVHKLSGSVSFDADTPSYSSQGDSLLVHATGDGSGRAVTVSTSTPDLCTVTPQSSNTGTGAATVAFDHAGTCTLVATQAGDDDHDAATATHDVSVDRAGDTITIDVGQGTITAQVDPVAPGTGIPTGTVELDDSESGFSASAPLTPHGAGAQATFSYQVPVGTQHLTAYYSGDADFKPESRIASTVHPNPRLTAQVSSSRAVSGSGWYRSPVIVRFICTPAAAPLTAPCPSPVHLSQDTRGVTVTRTIHATDGGTATTSTHVRIDRTAPTVRIAHARDAHPRCAAHDATSGIRSCHLHRSTHHARNGDLVVKLMAVAIDHAGNRTTTHALYRRRH